MFNGIGAIMGYLDCCDAGQTWTTGVKPQGQEASSAGATVVQSLTLGAYVKVCQLGGEELQLPLFRIGANNVM